MSHREYWELVFIEAAIDAVRSAPPHRTWKSRWRHLELELTLRFGTEDK